MKPSDRFYFLKNNLVIVGESLSSLYQPIIGQDAYIVYTYLVAFFDHGRAAHRLTDILNHVQFGFDRLLLSFDVLGALGLIKYYQCEQDYIIKLQTPLDRETFLANAVLKSLLVSRIGEVAVEELVISQPANLMDKTKRFSDVFTDRGEFYYQPQKTVAVDFNLEYFKTEMAKDGLRFGHELPEMMQLQRLSVTYKMTWFELYQLAKQTAVQNRLSLGRLTNLLEMKKSNNETILSPEEQSTLYLVKHYKPEVFLSLIKEQRKAVVTEQERQLLRDLAQMNFLDEVINVLVLYTMQKTKSANLNKVYLLKVANDFAYKNIQTAEAAMTYWRQPQQKSSTSSKVAKLTKTNVPEWSNPEYKEMVTEEEKKALDRQMDELLAQLDEEE